MGRGNLLSLLPDFSEGAVSRPEPRRPGFESLVAEAATRPEFQSIEMPTYFDGEVDSGDLSAFDPKDNNGLHQEIGDLGFDFDGPSLDEPLNAIDIDDAPPEAENQFDSFDLAGAGDEDGGSLPDLAAGGGDIDTAGSELAVQEATEALHASHQEEIAQLEASYQAALQDLVESAIPKAKTEIADAIAAELVPLLAGHLRASIADKMVAALVKEIGEILADNSPVTFELHGPEPLLLAFREQWGEDSALPKLIASDGIDLVARIDKSVLATRMSDVDRLLQEIGT